jgi:hypothetical protein
MKVVCIVDITPRRVGDFVEKVPVKGQVYTVRGRKTATYVGHGTHSGYYLSEIVNPPKPYMDGFEECAFHVSWFRPVTDISVFTRLLNVKKLEKV